MTTHSAQRPPKSLSSMEILRHSVLESQLWMEIIKKAKTDPILADMMGQAKLYYILKYRKNDEF